MKKQLKVEEGKLARLEEELQLKAAAAASVQNCFSYKVRDMLTLFRRGGGGGDCAHTDFEISPRSVNPIQSRGGGAIVPALTSDFYSFFHQQAKPTKLGGFS